MTTTETNRTAEEVSPYGHTREAIHDALTSARPASAEPPHGRARAEQLLQAEHELSQKWVDLADQIEAATAARGDALLRSALGEDGSEEAIDVDTLMRERTAVELAILTCRLERQRVLESIIKVEAVAARAAAQAKRAEAEALEAEVLPHLEALQQLVGRPFGVLASLIEVAGEVHAADGGPLPRNIALRNEASRFDRDAERIAARRPVANGDSRARTVADLVRQCTSDPLVIGPSIAALTAWAQAAERAERERRRRPGRQSAYVLSAGRGTQVEARPAGPVEFHVVWSGGEIDERLSRCGVPGAV